MKECQNNGTIHTHAPFKSLFLDIKNESRVEKYIYIWVTADIKKQKLRVKKNMIE